MNISQLVFRAEQINGSGIAVDDSGVMQSWQRTADRVRRMAGALVEYGVEQDDAIGILSHNGRHYLEALFAIPHCGARVVPLNTQWTRDELAFSAEDSNIRVLLFDSAMQSMAEQLRSFENSVHSFIFLGSAQEAPDWAMPVESALRGAWPLLDSLQSSEDVAGYFYTSGTTDRPKAVVLTHTNLFASAMALVASVEGGTGSRGLHAPPMFHISEIAFCLALTAMGGRHVIIPRFDAAAVIAACEFRGVTDLLLAPSMIQLVFDHPDFDTFKMLEVKRMVYGASPMPEGLLRRVIQAAPQMRLYHVYGQTEVAPVATILAPQDHVLAGDRARLLGSAGRACAAVQLKIVNTRGERVAAGEVGEICISGPNVMPGYLNRPKQTVRALRDGWMHTGDTGYLNEQGYLFVVDRVVDLINCGDERIFSVELERTISRHPSVAQVAVIAMPDDEKGEVAHAIVVFREGMETDEQSIVEHCRQNIAGYKCPPSIEFRNEPLPLSASGKILKRKLRAPYWKGSVSQVA